MRGLNICWLLSAGIVLLPREGFNVESGANVSDGLSREGLEDDWTKSQGWYLVNAVLPNFQELSKLPFQELCQQLQSLLAVV